ncbi:MAG TPA: MBL fold metallo-hydrolase [Blastocatellia bacterium]|nr:MBL fold metallo-hydrolase [Blastocatellia bacterium]HMV86091.1 MBL fold metallo-hydrolase [Blastocatellia bacterium]HMX27272.1 MBL fold metallo-hydrolase [Blastocatellia bacterium]HMY71540.1 MBL fold metallo-hydrolase [Blastocatellia bacterium]HMZ20246.1 MBL fold metallo-hydrolase [Blastocatellia bacterium]
MRKLLILAGLMLLCGAVISAQQSKTQCVLLGTGTPNADPDRFGPAVAVVVNDVPYVVDSGPGVVRRAAAAARNGVKGLAVEKLRRLFLTHLHSDHTTGLPDFIFTPAVLDRDAPLEIYGPQGTKRMTDLILKAYAEDIEIRLRGLEPAKPRGYDVRSQDVKPGVIYKDANVTVKAFAVKHGSWKHAYGYRFETPDRVIVISGDCAPSQSIIEACNGCDVLVHEVYSTTGFARRPPEWQRYHSNFHTSSKELAELATKAKPKLLVLYHQLLWGATKEQLLEEIGKGYSGKVVFGNDLDVF